MAMATLPEAEVGGTEGFVDAMDTLGDSQAMLVRHMAGNGPIRPVHIRRPPVITKQQLEAQKMREDQGYPSSEVEAAKVQALETRVAGIETGIQNILQAIQGGTAAPQAPPKSAHPLGFSPEVQDAVSRTVRGAGQQAGKAVVESFRTKPKPLPKRTITLPNGRVVEVARPQPIPPAVKDETPQSPVSRQPVSLGPVGESIVEEPEDPWGGDDDPFVEAAPVDTKLQKLQELTENVVRFMQTHDTHLCWRRLLKNKMHKRLAYECWPPELKSEADKRMAGYLNDAQFVTSICRKVLEMDDGYILGVEHVASFVVACAGFLAFALSCLEG
jgi:hypothetical protein